MTCCCPHARSAGRLFSFLAGCYRRRFARKGFEPSQRQLIEGLERTGFAGATVLEVGCGVGHLHQTLLERGAREATGVELAPRMLDEARAWAAQRGLADRTRYLEGDFMVLADGIAAADVTVLDKVVCCYPDAPGLLGRTVDRTRRTCALVYPRNRWFTRLGARVMTALMWALRSDFRPYIHDPDVIEGCIREGGLRKAYGKCTVAWHAQIWVRDPV